MYGVIEHPASANGLNRNEVKPRPQVLTRELKNQTLVTAGFWMIRESGVSIPRHRPLHRKGIVINGDDNGRDPLGSRIHQIDDKAACSSDRPLQGEGDGKTVRLRPRPRFAFSRLNGGPVVVRLRLPHNEKRVGLEGLGVRQIRMVGSQRKVCAGFVGLSNGPKD